MARRQASRYSSLSMRQQRTADFTAESWPQVPPLAQTFASLTLTGLAMFLSKEDFASWGWRVPFLMGVLLLVVGVFIRRRIEETPAFKENQKKAAESAVPQERALAVIAKKPGTVIKLVLSWAASAGLFCISVTYAVNYLTKELGYDNSITFGLLLIGQPGLHPGRSAGRTPE
ncbi:hypothetical protein AAHB34_01600 [Paenarthrobacter ureafaciens]